MTKCILITGATDGIGKLTAQMLASQGHTLLLHGRSSDKLDALLAELDGNAEGYLADLAKPDDIEAMAEKILTQHQQLDVLINNAGVLKSASPRTSDGLDLRFMVNTIAPFVLTKRLLPLIPKDGRIVNLSSAAQAPVDVSAFVGQRTLDDMGAYSQSKLAITIWTQELAKELEHGPVVVSVNPGSLLASKMVKEGFGVSGNDLSVGAKILCKAALDASFASASGRYFDNDAGRFSDPHPAAQDPAHVLAVMQTLRDLLSTLDISLS